MNRRLYSDVFDDFHTRPLIHEKDIIRRQLYLFATEYGFLSHYKDFGAFIPILFYFNRSCEISKFAGGETFSSLE
jgi:hypothetical protein